MRLLLLSILVELAGAAPLTSQNGDAVDSIVIGAMQQFQIPGAAIAVVRDGRILKKAVYGFANLETREVVLPSTPFQLSSTMKPFTATLVMRLVQEGRLSLDDTIGGRVKGLPATWGRTTIAQLLSHTSGLPDVAVAPGRAELIGENWESALDSLRKLPHAFAAGTRWAYNQTNYVLLGKMIEQLTNQPFDSVLTTMLRQLGMTSASFERRPGAAASYQRSAEGQAVPRSLSFPSYVHTAGGLFLSVDDLVRWTEALDAGKVLPMPQLTRMWTATRLADGSVFRLDNRTIGYGLGWVVNDRQDHRSVGHSGGNSTAYTRFLDDRLTVIVLHNGTRNPDALVAAIAAAIVPALAPSRP